MKTTIKTFTAASAILASSFAVASGEEPTINGYTQQGAIDAGRELCIRFSEEVKEIIEYRIADYPVYVVEDVVQGFDSPFEEELMHLVDVAYSATTSTNLWLEGSGEIASDYYKDCMGKWENRVEEIYSNLDSAE